MKNLIAIFLLSLLNIPVYSATLYNVSLSGSFGDTEPEPFAGQAYSFSAIFDESDFNVFIDRGAADYTISNTPNNEFTGRIGIGNSAFVDLSLASSFSVQTSNDLTLPGGTFIGDAIAISIPLENGITLEFDAPFPDFPDLEFESVTHRFQDPSGTLIGNDPTPDSPILELEEFTQFIANDFGSFTFTARTTTPSNQSFVANNVINTQIIANGTFDTFSIAVVPIPAALWLFLSALGFLGYIGRNKLS